MIDLYTWSTPNGRKVSIMLEACELPYRVIPVDIYHAEQFNEAFHAISPNNKIPAIVDREGPGGEMISLFESGAILIYLAEKTGRFIPRDPVERYEMLQWLMWQMGGFGPFLGQTHHFNRFAPEPVPYAIERYQKEAYRLWSVLDLHLQHQPWMVSEISIADFAVYPWAMRYEYQNIDPRDYPAVYRWMQQMDSLAYVRRGMAVPEPGRS